MAKIITCFGVAYKLNDTKYKKMLNDIIADKTICPDDYGKCLGGTVNITDMDATLAREELNYLIDNKQ